MQRRHAAHSPVLIKGLESLGCVICQSDPNCMRKWICLWVLIVARTGISSSPLPNCKTIIDIQAPF